MIQYRIGDKTYHPNDQHLHAELARIYGTKVRPLCLCLPAGVPMYISTFSGRFLIKRMPNSGEQHAPFCDSYEPPAELSGLGEVMGAAIQENVDEGTTTLWLGFPLTKTPGRAPPVPSSVEAPTARSDGSKLTLRGMLHYLWDQAGFNKWSPAMEGKRTWFVIRKYLLAAAGDKHTKGINVSDILYIPEAFTVEKRDEIAQRRQAFMSALSAPAKGPRRLMLALGEIKEIDPARYGHKIILKHAPDFFYMLSEDLHKRLVKRFDSELSLWDAYDDTHLMMLATFSLGATGVASIEEVALMNVTANWLPFENTYDKTLLDELTHGHRRFVRGLRYNMASSRPLAFAVLSDTQPQPTAMYIEPPGADEQHHTALDELIRVSKLSAWRWKAGVEAQPPMPLRGQYVPATQSAERTPPGAPQRKEPTL